MAKNNFEKCLAITLHEEGGFSNNPNDPGGATMEGITQATDDAWRKAHSLPPIFVKGISHEELYAIYYQDYWTPCSGDALDYGVDLCVFDSAVNSGVSRALHWLRETGPDIEKLCNARLHFINYEMNPRLRHIFGEGLRDRVEFIREQAKEMRRNNGATII